ncbi:MAG: AAA family ATPase, partial [Lachnospiraceae bacterium]|nr:AAA family ATPase [Lachnospiraceae bacterium]
MYTGTYLNPSNAAFKKRLNSEIYVDKTDLIKFCNSRVETGNCFICSTRPRRFGKSMAIDMLTAYYSKGCTSNELFDELNVSKYNLENKTELKLSKKFTSYLNNFDVIRIDMQDVMASIGNNSSMDAVDWIQHEVIIELKEVYGDCVKEGYELNSVLKNIFKIKKKQFIILIDEWDALFRLDKD